jgi:hypothetical protein
MYALKHLLRQIAPPVTKDTLRAGGNWRRWKSYPDCESALKDCVDSAY